MASSIQEKIMNHCRYCPNERNGFLKCHVGLFIVLVLHLLFLHMDILGEIVFIRSYDGIVEFKPRPVFNLEKTKQCAKLSA